jgi:hypothetical protein
VRGTGSQEGKVISNYADFFFSEKENQSGEKGNPSIHAVITVTYCLTVFRKRETCLRIFGTDSKSYFSLYLQRISPGSHDP